MQRLMIALLLMLTSLAVVLLLVLCPRPVYGVVSDGLDGRPVSGAAVLSGDCWSYSEQAGHYDLGWVRGNVMLTVRADGYLPAEEHVPRGRFPGEAVSLPIALAPNTVSGTIRDAETGDPLPGSTVIVGKSRVTADEYGRYTVRRVKTGSLFSAAMPGYRMATAVYGGRQVQDLILEPTETKVVVLDLYTEGPVSDALVVHGSARLRTDAHGAAILKRLLRNSILSVQASGYAAKEFVYDGGDTVSVPLRPNTLQGVVRDSSDGKPVAGAVVAAVSEGEVATSAVTDTDGRFSLVNLPSPVTLVVAAADYDRFERPVGPVTEVDVGLDPFQVRGIYMPLGLLTNERRVFELIDLVDRTELNAIVVDVKNDFGWLAYPSALVEIQKAGGYKAEVMDITKFLALCREKGIYAIARLVVFKDSTLAAAYPEWAARTQDGELWVDSEGSAWGDPFRAEVQDYNIAIAREVAALGFDELQFDYLRFPSDGAVGEIRYAQESTLESRTTAIREFCARLRGELEPYSVLLSADLFGLTVWVSPEEDMGIGQRVIDIAPYMDYLSPMLYPATFISGNLGYDEPLLHPYDVVYRSCVKLTERIEASVPPSRTRPQVRPWLQHYSTNGVTYGVEEMGLQKQAASDAQTYGWMFWHAAGKYDAQSFEPAKESTISGMRLW